MSQTAAARPMLQPFEQQLPPGTDAADVAWYAPRRPPRCTNLPPKGRLQAICPNGHALTLAQTQVGGPCPLCVAQAVPVGYSWPPDLQA